ncbi:MAG: glycosyltransferase [bacterium]
MNNKNLNIWLAYVSYPVTTAVYFERALRKHFEVKTIGPKINQNLVESWNLQNMKLPIVDHNLPTGAEPDMTELYNSAPADSKPDMYFWVESVYGYFPKNIDKLNIPTVCYFIDSHLNNLDYQLEWAKNFKYVFIAQKEYIKDFIKAGCKNVYWIPLGCDPEIHKSTGQNKIYDVGFVGGVMANPRRVQLIELIKTKHNMFFERCFWDEMAKVLDSSKIVFNNAVNNDLNMRVFETLSIGSFLLTDATWNNGQEEFFYPGEELGIYEDEYINDSISYYLENYELRNLIAKRGREIVLNAHTYEHRMLEIVDVAMGYKKQTPTGPEWRERSLVGVQTSLKDIYSLKRSFVIPVLDYAPASKYNIKTLLTDLEKIDGKLIVVFNSEEVAAEIKDHPRIDYYSVMKKNVGVARAWNIGLNMSQTPITFILNSDIHIENDVVDKVTQLIEFRGDAAMVGPQGSYFSFKDKADFHYFDKGSFDTTLEVDAVSGFLFGISNKLFDKYGLKFENKFTPCYFEEWDIGLQIKKAGLKSYIVPSKSYDHIWGGSIGSYRLIKYMDKEESAKDILTRNSEIYTKKWNEIHSELLKKDYLKYKTFFVSKYEEYVNNIAEDLINNKEYEKVKQILLELNKFYPASIKTNLHLGIAFLNLNDLKNALYYIGSVLAEDPENELATFINEKLTAINKKI